MIDPGRMDRRITIQSPSSTRTDSGQMVDSWVNTFSFGDGNIWAMKHSQSRKEGYEAEKKTAQRNEVFVIRYFSEVNERCTILYDGRRYDITGIEEIGRQEGLRIEATYTEGQYED